MTVGKIEYEEIKKPITSTEAATKKNYMKESLRNTAAWNANLYQLWKWKKIAEETSNTENPTYGEVCYC